MRVLVTGGAGFIGCHLSEALLRRGDDVTVLDNLLTGSRSNLAWCQKQSKFKFIEQDVGAKLPSAGQWDIVFHVASPASPRDYARHPLQTIAANSFGFQNVLELARKSDAVVVFTSTSEVYGEPLEHPQSESYRGNVSTTGPRAAYDESKRLGETLAATYAREFGVDVRIARIFNTYGPRMRQNDGRVIPAFLSAIAQRLPLPIFGDGSQTRSFCYVDDLVQGLLLLGQARQAGFEPLNLGNPQEHSIMEVAQLLCQLSGVRFEVQHLNLPVDDPTRRCPDISRARKVLGWEPRISLREGLQRLLEALKLPASAGR